jgi:hypothetical protein
MKQLVIFVKSYKGDLDKCVLLAKSYLKYCVDPSLAMYISTPQLDRKLFEEKIPNSEGRIQFITDEEVLGRQLTDSWHTQQLVKLNFYHLKVAKNYFWIDSDFIFIRDFSASEFFPYPDIPYFVCSNMNQDILSWKFNVETQGNEYKDMVNQVRVAMKAIQEKFGRNGPQYGYGAPAIWSVKVLENFEKYIFSQGLSFDNLISEIPFELNWYGEFALASNTIPIIPHQGFAYHITTDQQANFLSAIGINKVKLVNHGYLAVNLASKWNSINAEEWL